MAGRRFDVVHVVEVLEHWQAGRSLRHLARSLGMGRRRLREIVAAAEAAGLRQHGGLNREQLEALVPKLFAERVDRQGDQRRDLERFHEAIVAGLATNTARTVWQRLRDEHGLRASETTFRRYVSARVGAVSSSRVTVLKEVSPPGELAEVDYGRVGRVLDLGTGRMRVIHAFIMVLPASRHLFVDLVDRCDQESWVRSHVRAFDFFGGAPHVIRLDNLRTGVVRPDIYDPQFNRAYAEFAQHYGVLLDPCRVRHPRDKPHVERAVPYVRDSLVRGREGLGLSALRDLAPSWCLEVAGARPHRTLPGTVHEVFRSLEQGVMRRLPAHPFEVAHWATATVHPDCHVQVRKHLYTVPWSLVGKRVDVRVGERLVTVYSGGELVKTHVRQQGQRRYTDLADLPVGKVAFLQRTPAWCRHRATELGSEVRNLVDALLDDMPGALTRLRQVQAILRLAEIYPAARLNEACRRAAEADGSYRTVHNILRNGLDRVDVEEARPHDAGAFLHGRDQLLLEVAP